MWYDPDTASHEVVVANMRFENDIDLYNRTASEDIMVNWITYGDMSYRTQAAAYVKDSHIVVAADLGTLTGISTGSTVEIEVMGVLNGNFIRFWPRTITKTIDNWYDNDFSTFRYTSTTPLPDEIGVNQLRLYWKIKTDTGSSVVISEQMTGNTTYTLWSQPRTDDVGYFWENSAQPVPEEDPRIYVEVINYSCTWASGKNTEKEIMDAIFDGLWNEAYTTPGWRYTPGEGSTDGLILKTDTGSCGEWALFYHALVETQGIDVTRITRQMSFQRNGTIGVIGGDKVDPVYLYGHDMVLGGTQIEKYKQLPVDILLSDITDAVYDIVVGYRGNLTDYFSFLDANDESGVGKYMRLNKIFDLCIG